MAPLMLTLLGCDVAEAPEDASPSTVGGKSDSPTTCSGDAGVCDGEDARWEAFVARREEHLTALAEPILECITREDADHPAFHGCFDWHSHVHAIYALHVLFRVTGDETYLRAADQTLQPELLDDELREVRVGRLQEEKPYGFAWFLQLAMEREKTTGREDLRPLADELASRLESWLDARSSEQLRNGILGVKVPDTPFRLNFTDAHNYGNVPWAVMSLWEWGQWTGDDALSERMRDFVHQTLMDPTLDAACPLARDATDVREFFPPCLSRARAIVEIADENAVAQWLANNVEEDIDIDIEPLGPDAIDGAHLAGLNFSRAWNAFAMWEASGDLRWRDVYLRHIEQHLAMTEFWRDDYDAHSHWVPQFGVFALAMIDRDS